jgi:hypothetical protein
MLLGWGVYFAMASKKKAGTTLQRKQYYAHALCVVSRV